MSIHRMRWITAAVLALTLGLVAPVAAEEWKIHLLGKTEPIVANFYAEQTPWVFYKDDDSQYVFALGCNRISRIERDSREIPPPACPVERLPTSMPQVYIALVSLEDKRLDDAITRLREQTTAYARAVIGGAIGAEGFGAGVQMTPEDLALARARVATATSFLQGQINDTMFEITLAQQRVGALLDAAKSFPPRPRQRFYFAPR